MRVLAISHTDLDGISCQIVLRQAFGEITRMNISYNKIDEYIDIINDYCINNKPDKVFLTDLSFTEEQFDKLFNITKQNQDVTFYFIDHHPFKDDISQYKAANFHIVITGKASATKLTYLYLKSNFGLTSDTELLKYVNYVNAYDIWLKDTSEFQVGLVYNELFWEFKINHYWSRFKDEFTLRQSNKETFKNLMNKKKKIFSKLETSGRLLRLEEQKIFMVFIDDFRGWITLDYPDYNVYFIIASYGGFSIRLRNGFSQDGAFKNAVVKRLLRMENVNSAGGHNSAFGGILNDASAHKQIELAKDILIIIDEEQDKILLK